MAEENKNQETTPKKPSEEVLEEEKCRKNILQKYRNDEKNYFGRYRTVDEFDIVEGKSGEINEVNFNGGFYYDSQLEDPYLSMSLHANTKITKEGTWEKWSTNMTDCLEPVNEENDWSRCYGKQPIARCILSEDFSYSIGNNFSDYNGGNAIEGAFETFKPFAPILGAFGENGGEAADEMLSEGSFGSDLVKGASSFLGKAAKISKKASKYLNKALFVEGTRFTYYNGTTFNFNNMEMKFLAFSDYVSTDGSNWVFQSVEDYVKTLQPYVMGLYTPYSAQFLEDTGIQGKVKEFIQQYVGFQDPPGGFEMSAKNLNNTLKGTLRLNIGGTWAIENLVVKSMNVNMSRVQAKHPEIVGKTVPLYAEISLQLAPACSIVDTSYGRILDHSGLDNLRIGSSNSYRDKLNQLKSHYIKN